MNDSYLDDYGFTQHYEYLYGIGSVTTCSYMSLEPALFRYKMMHRLTDAQYDEMRYAIEHARANRKETQRD